MLRALPPKCCSRWTPLPISRILKADERATRGPIPGGGRARDWIGGGAGIDGMIWGESSRPAGQRDIQRGRRFGERFVRTYKIAAIPGDGIGIEVVGAGLDVLQAC